MHGKGTLTLKNGQTFSGKWVDDILEDHKAEISKHEKAWQAMLDQEEEARVRIEELKKIKH